MFKILKSFLYRSFRHIKVKVNHLFSNRHKKQGQKLANLLLKRKDAATALYIAGPGMGDVLYGAAFLHAFRCQYPIKKLIVITPPRFIWLMESYKGDFDKVISMKGKYKKFRYLFNNEANLDLYFNHKILTTRTVIDLPIERRSAMTQLKTRIFKVGTNAVPQFHSLQPNKVTSIPDFDKNCHKIVVFNPYSPSCHLGKKEIQYFEKIANFLREKDYIVYTNVVQDRMPIKNTIELRCSLQQMLGIAEKIPFIVSIRSGLLDFIVKTNINMFVIYSEGGVIRRDIYTLKDWGCNGKLKEVTYDEIHQDAHLNLFKNFLETLK